MNESPFFQNIKCISSIYDTVPIDMLSSVFFFHKCIADVIAIPMI